MIPKTNVDMETHRYIKARRPELYRDIIGQEHTSEQKVVWLQKPELIIPTDVYF